MLTAQSLSLIGVGVVSCKLRRIRLSEALYNAYVEMGATLPCFTEVAEIAVGVDGYAEDVELFEGQMSPRRKSIKSCATHQHFLGILVRISPSHNPAFSVYLYMSYVASAYSARGVQQG